MNIIEALKSGNPFKRKDWPEYWQETEQIKLAIPLHEWIFRDDILAEDWEIKEDEAIGG